MEKYHAVYQWKILIYLTYNEMNETTKFNSHMCHDKKKNTPHMYFIFKRMKPQILPHTCHDSG